MPFAATPVMATPLASGVDARAHATMPARTTSAHSAALEAWICALLMALLGNHEPLRQLFPHLALFDLPEDEDAAARLIRHAIRAENRLRARVAWLVRQHPNRGPRPSARRPPPEKPVLKTPLPAAMTHARMPARSLHRKAKGSQRAQRATEITEKKPPASPSAAEGKARSPKPSFSVPLCGPPCSL